MEHIAVWISAVRRSTKRWNDSARCGWFLLMCRDTKEEGEIQS